MFSKNLDFFSLQQHILISFQTYVFHLKASKYVNFEKCVSKYRTDRHVGGILRQGLLSSCLPSDPCFIFFNCLPASMLKVETLISFRENTFIIHLWVSTFSALAQPGTIRKAMMVRSKIYYWGQKSYIQSWVQQL